MVISEWLPDVEWPWKNTPDEEFDAVYEAYEEFYRRANTPSGRGGMRMSAGQDFMEEVMEFYDAGEEEANAGVGMGLFLNADGEYEPNPLDEKYGKEELFEYLNGNL